MDNMRETVVYDKNDNQILRLVQWDIDVYINIKNTDITSAQPIHFFTNSSPTAYTVESEYINNAIVAKIPNLLLRESDTIYGYVYNTDDTTRRSVYGFRIPIIKRPQPSDYVFQDTVDYVRITEVLASCQEYAESASDSKTSAANYAKNAETYMNNASTYATSAKTSEDNADKSASSAATYAANAKDSEGKAKSSAAEATASASEAKQYAENVENSIENITNDLSSFFGDCSALKADISIPITGWADDTDTGGLYSLYCDISNEEISENMFPILTIWPTNFETAMNCGFATFTRTINGTLRVYANDVPEEPIHATLLLLYKASGSTSEV